VRAAKSGAIGMGFARKKDLWYSNLLLKLTIRDLTKYYTTYISKKKKMFKKIF